MCSLDPIVSYIKTNASWWQCCVGRVFQIHPRVITRHLFRPFLILTFRCGGGMKNDFSYYNTTPLITSSVVINPLHLLLCGGRTLTHTESISHGRDPLTLPFPLTAATLNIFLVVFPPPLSVYSIFLSAVFGFYFSFSHSSYFCFFDRTQLRLLLRHRQLHLLLLPGKRGGARLRPHGVLPRRASL